MPRDEHDREFLRGVAGAPFRRGPFGERDSLLSDAKHLQGLIDRFGADVVWEVGINVLGYPPSWLVGPEDALTIQDAIEER